MFCTICGKSTKFNKELCPRCEFNSVITGKTEMAKKPIKEEVPIEEKPIEEEVPIDVTDETTVDESHQSDETAEIGESTNTVNTSYVEKLSNIMDELSIKKSESADDKVESEDLAKDETVKDFKTSPAEYMADTLNLGDVPQPTEDDVESIDFVIDEEDVEDFDNVDSTDTVDPLSAYKALRNEKARSANFVMKSDTEGKSHYEKKPVEKKQPTGKMKSVSHRESTDTKKDANVYKSSTTDKPPRKKDLSDGSLGSKYNWGRIAVVAIVLVVVVVGIVMAFRGGLGTNRASQSGFRTPEAAVVHYLEGLRDSDFDKMMSAFALEVYVENHDFQALLERLHVYYPTMEIRMPNVNELATSINIENRRSTVAGGIEWQYFNLAQIGFDYHAVQYIEDVEEFTELFEGYLLSPNLGSLEIVGFIPPEYLSEVYLSVENQNNILWQTGHLGLSERASKVAVFNIDGQRHILIVELGNYNGEWFILQFGGNLSQLLAMSHYKQGLLTPEHIDNALWWIDSIDDLIVR